MLTVVVRQVRPVSLKIRSRLDSGGPYPSRELRASLHKPIRDGQTYASKAYSPELYNLIVGAMVGVEGCRQQTAQNLNHVEAHMAGERDED